MSEGIRTLSHLQEAMARDFAWRKKELHSLKTMVIANKSSHNKDLCIRAAVTLLYAHWEGFVRRIGGAYLEFVARQQIVHDRLPANFLAMAINRLVSVAAHTNRIQKCLDVVDFFRTQMKSSSRLNWKSGVNTKQNLNSTVFREIVVSLGLDYLRFETKEKLIDEQLLANRNRIAHGQFSLVDLDEYLNLQSEVQAMMQDFYNQVDNRAFSGEYQLS